MAAAPALQGTHPDEPPVGDRSSALPLLPEKLSKLSTEGGIAAVASFLAPDGSWLTAPAPDCAGDEVPLPEPD
jgi:hypothetical protein